MLGVLQTVHGRIGHIILLIFFPFQYSNEILSRGQYMYREATITMY